MEQARRLIAAGGRLRIAKISRPRLRRRYSYRRPLQERLRLAIAGRRPDAADLARRRAQIVRIPGQTLARLQEPRFMMRAFCVGGALLLLFVLISSASSGSTANVPSFSPTGKTPSASASGPAAPAPSAQTPAAAPASAPPVNPSSHSAHSATSAPRATHPSSAASSSGSRKDSPTSSGSPSASPTHTAVSAHATPVTSSSHVAPVAHTPKSPTPTPAPPKPVTPCATAGVHCDAGLISGGGSASLSPDAYRGLTLRATTLSQALERFGPPTSRSSLQRLLGTETLASLISSQPSGDSCAYYIAGPGASAGAFQLCFGAGFNLVEKAIVSSSG